MSQPKQLDSDTVQRIHLSHFLDNASSPCLESLPASFVDPGAYWSGTEKDSFFKSLARHSRWKPDLIAEDVGGGKSIADVCSYIELLEQGFTGESQKSPQRDAYPTAHEVSEEWVAVENAAAEALLQKETEWQAAALKQRRSKEIKELKNSLPRETEDVWESPRGGSENHTSEPHSPKRKRSASNQGDLEGWEDRYAACKRELRSLWKREDTLSILNARYLKTMDKMVQTQEVSDTDKAIKRAGKPDFDGIVGNNSAQLDASAFSNSLHHADAASATQYLGHTSNTSHIDSQIDPVLFALDGNVANAQALSHDHHSDKGLDHATLSSKDLQLAIPLAPQGSPTPGRSILPDSAGAFGTSLPAQSLLSINVPQTPSPSSPLIAKIPSNLSPASRRRLQKRLWARRKRAVESGLPVSQASMEMVKLKRGRKPKTKPVDDRDQANEDVPEAHVGADPHLEGLSHPPPSSEPRDSAIRIGAVNEFEDKDGASDGSESKSKRKPYGWGKLTARQVSGMTLRTDGMDLFHMDKFASMMSLLGHVHALSNEDEHIDQLDELAESSNELSTISYPLLRLLRACLIQFVTCLVSCVVLHKDVENRQKRRIRGIFLTGGAEEIRAENVRECLRHMKRETSTKLFFMKLKCIARKAIASHSQTEEETGSGPGSSGDDSEATESSDNGSSDEQTVHNATSTMFASDRFQHSFLPPGDDSRAAAPLFWNPDVLSMFSEGKDGTSLLPDKMDETGLQMDLRAEEKVEEVDHEAARKYERELWMEIGVKRGDQDEPVVEMDTKHKNTLSPQPEYTGAPGYSNAEGGLSHSLRFRKPGGTVKSRVYIESDEDN